MFRRELMVPSRANCEESGWDASESFFFFFFFFFFLRVYNVANTSLLIACTVLAISFNLSFFVDSVQFL